MTTMSLVSGRDSVERWLFKASGWECQKDGIPPGAGKGFAILLYRAGVPVDSGQGTKSNGRIEPNHAVQEGDEIIR